ncbi:hypothetical protein TNCV_2334231 [Trichonephila clavipes]|nr:hypothetical protein TNCV_2334231 [Trichonephila clavipes]
MARFTPVVSRSFDPHSSDITIWLDHTPVLKENTLGWSGAFQLSSPSTNFRRGLVTRRLLNIPRCHTSTTRIETTMPSAGFERKLNGTRINLPSILD